MVTDPKKRFCHNPECDHYGKYNTDSINLHGFSKTSHGKSRRFLCKECESTFGSTAGTIYHGKKYPKLTIDMAISMSVEGIDDSAIGRVLKIDKRTVRSWINEASAHAKRFNDENIKGFKVVELQADELYTFIDSKEKKTWVIAMMDVWSRLWISDIVGRRNFSNISNLLNEVTKRGIITDRFLFATDGYAPYEWASKKIFKSACVYGQVIKKRKNNRVTRVTRKVKIGTLARLEELLLHSEDSNSLNSAFIERLMLTIRKGCSYLGRKTSSHARQGEYLADQVSLFRCYYNFVRPHSGLKFGTEVYTPAMQAGIVDRKLTIRDMLSTVIIFAVFLSFYGVKTVDDRCSERVAA